METNIMNNMEYDPIISTDRYKFNNKSVPRATEILSLMNDPYIATWANSLGFRHKKYEQELEHYANIGTIVHDLCDKIMVNESFDISEYPRDIANAIHNGTSAFKSWWNMMNERYTIEIVAIEKMIACQWYGGTCDVILKINGQTFLGDFKTSNHVGYKYYCQLAAYTYVLETEFGIHIDGWFILQLSKTKPVYKEYILNSINKQDMDFMSNAYNCFMGAVYTYYCRLQMQQTMESLSYNKSYLNEGGFLS